MIRNLGLVIALGWLVLVAALVVTSPSKATAAAVVTANEVIARSADSIHAPHRFQQPLPGGTEVQIVERRDDWRQVRLADGRDIWLPASSLTEVFVP